MTPAIFDPPGPRAGEDLGTSTPRARRVRSASEIALAELMADPDLDISAKALARLIDDKLAGEGNAASFLGPRSIARQLGWADVKDGGRSRVNRIFARLTERGYGFRLSAGEFWAWYKATGERLGLKAPKPGRRPRGFFVAAWRLPQARPEDWACPIRPPQERGASAPKSTANRGAGASEIEAPAPQQQEYLSSELKCNYVTAAPLAGEKAPEAGPAQADPPIETTGEQVAQWLADLRPGHGLVKLNRMAALIALDQLGLVPAEWRDKVPPREQSPRPNAEADRPACHVTLTPSELLDNRIRRAIKAGPGAISAEELNDLAFDISRSIYDGHSKATHRTILINLIKGEIKWEPYRVALTRARKARPEEAGKEFGKSIKPYRPEGREKRPVAGTVFGDTRRPAPNHPH